MIKQIFRIVFSLSLSTLFAGCSVLNPYIQNVKEMVISPTPTPTITLTPTITPTSTTTPTPEPVQIGIQELLTDCTNLSTSKNLVIVEGNIYLPEYRIYGYEGWRGMNLTQFLPSEPVRLTVLIRLGQGPNTMDDLPEFFSEKDLTIRSFDNQIIRYGHSVRLFGKLIYKEENTDRKCELQVEKIESRMPKEVLTPLELVVKDLDKELPHMTGALPMTYCSDLALKKQLVKIKGQILYWGYKVVCTMGYCQVMIADDTGKMRVSIVQGAGSNSIDISAEKPAPGGWYLFNNTGDIADKQNLVLTGILHSEIDGCRLMVYQIE